MERAKNIGRQSQQATQASPAETASEFRLQSGDCEELAAKPAELTTRHGGVLPIVVRNIEMFTI